MSIKISCIIPLYNSENSIATCLRSILNQTYKNIEIIIVDDFSVDNSRSIVSEFAKKFKNIIFLKNDKNYGAGTCRNIGIDNASGEYIHFIDSDDEIIDNNVYKLIIKKIEEIKVVDIIKFRSKAYDLDSGKYIYKEYYEEKKTINKSQFLDFNSSDIKILSKLCITPWASVYRLSFLKSNKIKFNNLKVCNDRSFSILSLVKAKKIYFYDIYVVKHTINNHSSLRGIRHLHFSCDILSYFLINAICRVNNVEKRAYQYIIQEELVNLLAYYKVYIKNNSISSIFSNKNNDIQIVFDFLDENQRKLYLHFKNNFTIFYKNIFEDLFDLIDSELWINDIRKALIISMKRSGKFDEIEYIKAYPDVKSCCLDPIEHYINFGINEGRKLFLKKL